MKSPLRYVGGKSRAIAQLMPHFEGTEKLFSLFFGGGSFELAYGSGAGRRVEGVDLFRPVAEFWVETLADAGAVADEASQYHPMTADTYRALTRTLSDEEVVGVEMAGRYFALNRASFSGSVGGGGMSPSHPRFTPSSLEYLRWFYAPSVEVSHGCAFAQIERLKEIDPEPEKCAIYADPPYLIEAALYGLNGNMHRGFNHRALAESLSELAAMGWPVVVSYNNHPLLSEWYSEQFSEHPVEWAYSMTGDSQSDEVLFIANTPTVPIQSTLSEWGCF